MKEVKSITWSSKQLFAMQGKGTIKFDCYVQRNKCWDLERKSLLIRTMLNGFPRIPEIYATRESSSKVYQCLDGQQRLTTVFDFMDEQFALGTVEPITDEDGNEHELSGKKFSDLQEELQDIILTYSWRIAYYDDLSDDDVAELFFLTNNGMKLTSIEHMRANCPCLREIQTVGSHELFTTALTEKAFARYTNEDLVVKSYMMLYESEPCLDSKAIKPVMASLNLTEENVNTLNAVYDRLLETYKILTNEDDVSKEEFAINKRAAKRILTRTHMLSIIPICKRSIDEEVSAENFAKWVVQFFSGTKSPTLYEDYNDRATSGSGHAESVRIRLETVTKDYEKFIKVNKTEETEE